MKREKHEAIVLQTWPSRERDKLVSVITPERGKVRGWVYGARSARNRFGASLEPLAKIRIQIIARESDDAVRIESVDLVRSMFPAQQNLRSSLALTYMAELVDTFSQSDEPSELVFRLLDSLCEAMLSNVPAIIAVAYAEVWMLKLAGILPSIRDCVHCGSAIEFPLTYDEAQGGFACRDCANDRAERLPNDVSRLLSRILKSPVGDVPTASLRPEDLVELRGLMTRLRREFLGHELKSFELLQTVLLAPP